MQCCIRPCPFCFCHVLGSLWPWLLEHKPLAAPLHAQPQGALGSDEDGVAQGTLPLTPQDCFAVVTAGVQETTRLLENKFDYIFFTGTSLEPEPRSGT